MLRFIVRNQLLSRVDNFRPVEKSINYLTASFEFRTEDWTGAAKKAICRNTGTGETYEAPLQNDACLIPWEVLKTSGMVEISVWGVRGEQEITTSVVGVRLGGTLADGAESNPPTPTELDRIRQSIGDLDSLETEARESLVAAINELVNKGNDYILTEEDKHEIAEMAAGMVETPDSGGNADLTDEEYAELMALLEEG